MKARLDRVAELAGVGIATVDRVLNERGNVSPRTALKVIEAARQLGISRTLPSPHRRLFRVKVIMPPRIRPLVDRLARAFESQIAITAKTLVIERTFFEERQSDGVPDLIRTAKADAVIVFGPETGAMVEAIAAAAASGIPTVTLGSDLPTTPRLAYVGIDHYSAGRAAAFFMSRMAGPGVILAVCFNTKYRAEALRISGFRDGMNTGSASLQKIQVLEGEDWSHRDLRDHVSGIYIAGSERELALAIGPWLPPGPVVIVHDLGKEVIKMLDAGSVTLAIDQNPEEQAARSIAVLSARFGLSTHVPGSSIVPFTLHTLHNIPP